MAIEGNKDSETTKNEEVISLEQEDMKQEKAVDEVTSKDPSQAAEST